LHHLEKLWLLSGDIIRSLWVLIEPRFGVWWRFGRGDHAMPESFPNPSDCMPTYVVVVRRILKQIAHGLSYN
jgi:hypothetical protein